MTRFLTQICVLALGAPLAACATSGGDANLAAASEFAKRELAVPLRWNNSEAARAEAEHELATLLAQPLSTDDAVRIALGYSPAFQQLLAQNAAAAANAAQASRMINPRLQLARLSAGGLLEIDRMLAVSMLDLVLAPPRLRAAATQRLHLQTQAMNDIVGVVTSTRHAWIEAVAAKQAVQYAEQVQQAALSSAELAHRMMASGNFARLEQAREQVFLTDATVDLSRSRSLAMQRREALIRLLGLRDAQALALKLPPQLPALPAIPEDEKILARRAFEERLDVQIARRELQLTALSLGLTRVTSTVNALDVAALRNSRPEGDQRGVGMELQLPIFDFGGERREHARALYAAALAKTAGVVSDAQSNLRESYGSYRAAYDLAVYYRDEVIPLRKVIHEENQLRYNGMLISVFELLADAREQVSSVRQALMAQRDFWLADATLRATMLGRPIGPATTTN
jgi:outer membrane protein TolC